MKVFTKTLVKTPFDSILPSLDFTKLEKFFAWPLPLIKLKRFDGYFEQAEFELEFDWYFFQQTWQGLITAFEENEQQVRFTDEIQKPFGLFKQWKHQHHFIKLDENMTEIIDDVEFSSGYLLIDLSLLPIIYTQFFLRKPMYHLMFHPLTSFAFTLNVNELKEFLLQLMKENLIKKNL